ncbi:MAG: hypothetical protein K6F50_06230 [Kiritimatiellae bacterium]|nr:hypothetical protein [Kiritimatiellia bacterium]
MQEYENWEKGCGWETLEPAGGREFHAFVKDEAIPVLRKGIEELEAMKRKNAETMRRWGEIAGRAESLFGCFTALTGSEDFMTMVRDFDFRAAGIFGKGTFHAIEDWLEAGIRLTRAMKNGSSVPRRYAEESAAVERDLKSTAAVRDILAAFLAASDDDRRLKLAPVKYRTRIFRDLTQNIAAINEAKTRLNPDKVPAFLEGIMPRIGIITEFSGRLQAICRAAKKKIKRHGSEFWTRLDDWMAMRRAV